jgi:hypothetical protein
MFNKTYVTQYANNREIFQQFFDNLKKFYNDYPINIENVIRKLLVKTTKIIYNLLTSLDVDEKCIEQNFDQIQPFSAYLPIQMQTQLSNALESVKLYTSGLTKIRDLILNMYTKFSNSSYLCIREYTQVTKCALCYSNSSVDLNSDASTKSCYIDCLGLFKTCFVIDMEYLDTVWDMNLSRQQSFQCIFNA